MVPNLRCARPISAIASGVGVSLNRTPPPPLTCRSMKPGQQNLAVEVAPDRARGDLLGAADRGDAAAAEAHGEAFPQAVLDEHPAVDER